MSNVICHIAGPSGSGKTTILKKIQEKYPQVIAKDLDEFDDQASAILNLDSTEKKNWKDDDFKRLADLRQELMDEFIKQARGPVVFGGHHREDVHILRIPTANNFLIDVDAHTSALRAYHRSQSENPKHRRKIEDLPFDRGEAQQEMDFLLAHGYTRKSEDEILQFIGDRLG